MRLALFIFLSITTFIAFVNTQGESCNAHDGKRGVCIELPSCVSLITLYRNNPSQGTIDILRANQGNCGNRKVGRNPLMCCSDNVPQELTQPVVTRNEPPCNTPDSIRGFCINVKQCPSVLNTFIQRQRDPEYIQYIRQSNANCNYVSQTICCPNEAPATTNTGNPVSLSTRSGLLNPPQCGVSKVPHNRVVGGVPAMLGG
ncbi:hypothetical protein PVAND_004588 [Polypedilum vanderplanki]|uniref:Clip domain-containing protein n=1 Tax=Polypedilum vanderplanki TaxID=319348 RepID=A0A9J6BY10_POLVA|nr:hypothetical protein PVAND_004588 [Polypedilum vanderplanki]